jgi:hypothetical protein
MFTNEDLKKLRWTGNHTSTSSTEIFGFFGLEWDIEAMRKHITKLNITPTEVDLAPLGDLLGFLYVDKEYARKSTKTDPLILIELNPNELMLVDGCHRTFRDLEKGLKTGKAFIVPFKEQVKFLYSKYMFTRIKNMAKKRLEELNS